MPEPISDMNRNQEPGFFNDFYGTSSEEPLEINMRNLENLTLLDNINPVSGLGGLENNENVAFYHQDYDSHGNPQMFQDSEDSKEPNVSRTVRVPTSEHVAEIVGRQGCKIKDLRARTNTYIKTPMRTEPPVFVVTGRETAVNVVIAEINSAAEHFTQIRASRNHHKNGGGTGEVSKPATREGDVVQHVTVPYRVVGLVVGLKGQTIKQIQQDTDTFIVTPNRDKAPIFEIRGQPANVERAKTMIVRHIEMRTRNSRLQDTTNLQTNWNGGPPSEDVRFSGNNDYHYYYSEASPVQNGSNTSSNTNNSNGPPSHNYGMNGVQTNGNGFNTHHSPTFNQFSSSSSNSSPGNYNWKGYTGMMEPSNTQALPISTWSNATSDYPAMQHAPNGASPMRGSNGVHQSMSTPSNKSSDFMDGSFPPRQITGPVGGSPSRRISDHSCEASSSSSTSFPPNFPLLSTASTTSTRGSLVLGNLFQPPNYVVSSLNVSDCGGMMTGPVNGFGQHGNDITSFAGSGNGGEFCVFKGNALPTDPSGVFGRMGSDMGDFNSGDSSPASKSCSLSEATGSQGSPTPRMCKVCEEADVVAALVPCGHNHFCMECAEGVVNKSTDDDKKCPVCNVTATDVLRILA